VWRANTLMLDEDESFSMSGNVLAPGYQSVVLRGYLVRREPEGTYIAPLIPQLFYGADGTQLASWRQYIPAAGEQVLLSRSGGEPSVPKEELFWRRVPSREEALREAEQIVEEAVSGALQEVDFRPLILLGAIALILFWRR